MATKRYETKIQLLKISRLLDRVEDEFNKIYPLIRDNIHDFSAECYSLNHCIRWGINSISELLDHIDTITNIDYE